MFSCIEKKHCNKVCISEKKSAQRGLSLIEASMVLALSAVVVAGAVMYYGSAAENSKVQRVQGQIGGIQAAVASLYANQTSYTGITAELLKNSGALPNSYFDSQNQIVNPWTGTVEIAVDSIDNTKYTLTYNKIPARACVKLLTSDPGTSLRGVSVDGTDVDENLPLDLTAAIDKCDSENTPNGAVDIVYTLS